MRDKREHLEPKCNAQRMSETTAKTETDFEDTTKTVSRLRSRSRVPQVFFASLHTLLGFVLCFVSSMEFLSL